MDLTKDSLEETRQGLEQQMAEGLAVYNQAKGALQLLDYLLAEQKAEPAKDITNAPRKIAD